MEVKKQVGLLEMEMLNLYDFIVADVTLKDGSKKRVLRAATASQRIGGNLLHTLRFEDGVGSIDLVTEGVITHRVLAKSVEVRTYTTNLCPKKPDVDMVRGFIARMFPAVPISIETY